jgi:hypothetical protein
VGVPSGVCLVCWKPWPSTEFEVNLVHSRTHSQVEIDAATVLLEAQPGDMWDDAIIGLTRPDV